MSAQWPWESPLPSEQAAAGDAARGANSLTNSALEVDGAAKLGIEAPRCGLGVRLRHSSRGLLSVATLLPGGPAHSSGLLRENDQILCVDGSDTFGKPIQQVAKLFVGVEGSSVDLKICRDGLPPHHVHIIRKAFDHLVSAHGASSGAQPKSGGGGIPPRAPTTLSDAAHTLPSAVKAPAADVDVDGGAAPVSAGGAAAGAESAGGPHKEALSIAPLPAASDGRQQQLSAVFQESPYKSRSLFLLDELSVFQRPPSVPTAASQVHLVHGPEQRTLSSATSIAGCPFPLCPAPSSGASSLYYHTLNRLTPIH